MSDYNTQFHVSIFFVGTISLALPYRWWRGVVVNALVAINEVTLRRARLVLGWVTVCGRMNHLGTSHPGQLSLAIPPWVGAMSTSESWGVNRHTARALSPYPWSRSVSRCLAEGYGNGDQRHPMGPCGSGRTLLFYYFIIVPYEGYSNNGNVYGRRLRNIHTLK